MNLLDSIRKNPIPWIVAAVLVLSTAGTVAVVTGITRGLRNNNPGNIRRGNGWQGLRPVQTDTAFDQFITAEWGIRALARVLKNYYAQGLTTVRAIINRYAPPSENITTAYVDAVAKSLGVGPDEKINLNTHLFALIAAIIKHENGIQPYATMTISNGIALESNATLAANQLTKDLQTYNA